jgi:hypothetical protein
MAAPISLHKKYFTEFLPAFQVELYTERIFKTCRSPENAKSSCSYFVFYTRTNVAIPEKAFYACLSLKDNFFGNFAEPSKK